MRDGEEKEGKEGGHGKVLELNCKLAGRSMMRKMGER